MKAVAWCIKTAVFVCVCARCNVMFMFLHRLSFDEGRVWSKYSFTSSPLFVDGVLGEPGEETLIMTYVFKKLDGWMDGNSFIQVRSFFKKQQLKAEDES